MGRTLLIVLAVATCGAGMFVVVRLADKLGGAAGAPAAVRSSASGGGGRLGLPPLVDSRNAPAPAGEQADAAVGSPSAANAGRRSEHGGVESEQSGDAAAAGGAVEVRVVRSLAAFLPMASLGRRTRDGEIRWAGERHSHELTRQLQRAEAALADDPDHETALEDAADALQGLERWSEAADRLGRLARVSGKAAHRAAHADALLRAARWIDAIEPLRAMATADPNDTRARFNLAVALTGARRMSEARRAWDEVIDGMAELPTVEPALIATAGAPLPRYGTDEMPNKRRDHQERPGAAALEPVVEARRARGEVLLDLRLWDDAAADLATVAAADPADGDAAMNLALALHHGGRASEARDVLQRALAAAPRSVPLRNRLAELYWTQLQRGDALANGAAAVRRAPEAGGRMRDAGQAGAEGEEPLVARVREIVRLCDESLEIDPSQPLIRALRARAAVWPATE
ncbi:MAG: tetratricopeptide repeat protein [Planctomycetia bacterium]|nr:MAG: tetratricopeptide repeat protein [Planctomycetia bacterium]